MRPSSRSATSTLWLQLLLVGALVSVALLVVQTYRTARSNRELTDRALRDYGAFAAWSYREHLVSEFRAAADEVLGPVNHGEGMHVNPRVPAVADIGHLLPWSDRCNCHRLERGPLPTFLYAFVLGSDSLGVALNYAEPGAGWLTDPPLRVEVPNRARANAQLALSPDDARWVNTSITDLIRAPTSAKAPYPMAVIARGDTIRVLVTRPMPTEWGDTVVYGYEYDQTAINAMFRDVLSRSDLLPPSLVGGRTNADIIDLEVTHPAGGVVFTSGPAAQWELASEIKLPPEFGALQVRAQIRPALGESLLIGGVPQSRIPVLLVMLVLALGLTVVAAVQLRRDVRFASDRAQFVANVSHELRTPLAQVRLVIDTIRLGRDTDATMRSSAVELADREVLRLQHLVDGLLRFTRGSRPNEARVRIDLANEARLAAREFAPLALPRGITIDVTAAEAAPVAMQQGSARQILLNLLDNAVKYGRDNAPVQVTVTTDGDRHAEIAVIDAGPGVPHSEREHIWKPFARGRAAEDKAAGGSGIGLTIVRDIAREHGGDVRVDDAPGGGARFVVRIPLVTS